LKETRKTRLHGWHTEKGATMAEFSGYDMPLWYPSGSKREHLSVLTGAGLFDTSHMSVIIVDGEGAFDLLQYCFSRDLDHCGKNERKPLAVGKCIYGVFLNASGCVIDDAVLYRLGQTSFMVVVNAGMGPEITRHLEKHRNGLDAVITDQTGKIAKIDIQGPSSARILFNLLVGPETIFQAFSYFSFKGHFDSASPLSGEARVLDDVPILLSRSGYTGEFGFEMFIESDGLYALWESVLEAGDSFDLACCGLAARDSLRCGAGLPLARKDIGNWPFLNNPWQFALPFKSDRSGFTKKFIGADALKKALNTPYTYPFVGFDPRKVRLCASPGVIDEHGKTIGTVLTCTTDMGIGFHDGRVYSIAGPDKPDGFIPKGLSCGFLKVKKRIERGKVVEIDDGRRRIKVMVTADIRPDRTAHRPINEMIQ